MIFIYTTAAIVVEKPVGLLISSFFIASILLVSFISRIARSRELRFAGFKPVDIQSKLLWDTIRDLDLTILVPHRPGRRTLAEKEQSIRREHRIPRDLMVVFVEVELTDASEFVPEQVIHVREEQGRYILRITEAASISHTLAALALEMAKVGRAPEIHFGWTDESVLSGTLGFLLFGEGNVPWMVRALIRKAEPNPAKRPLLSKPPSTEPAFKSYVVRGRNETLRSVARDQLGDSEREDGIFRINRDEFDGDSRRLKPGMALRIPNETRKR